MAVLKCKMCGGDLNVTETDAVIQCEYCGTRQTVPTADNEKKLNLFNRANRLRMASEFDKAAGIYENIIAEFPEEAEAYWGLCLCNYGIEYVDDPATAKKIPTCHRASFESLQKDENFGLALEYADVVAQKLYRDEAREIDRIMSEILAVSKNEKPYDVFICYKETDDKGQRTPDSVLAQDIYDALTAKGLKVFFSRITLEDKLGMQYEPYIFAALNSAKVMLSIGTKYEYFHAVWVKNEWSRFLKLMAKDKSKVLIPCFKDIDAYDMPDEFKGLQAQDLGKLGAVQDIVRGVEKIVGKTEPVQAITINQGGGPNAEALLKRGYIALEDGNFTQATEFFNQVLNMNAECAEAYLGIAMAEEKTETKRNLVFKNNLDNRNYQRAKQFADSNLLKELNALEAEAAEDRRIKEEERRAAEEELRRAEIKKLDSIRENALHELENGRYFENSKRFGEAIMAYQVALNAFVSLADFKDSKANADWCRSKIKELEEIVNPKLTFVVLDSNNPFGLADGTHYVYVISEKNSNKKINVTVDLKQNTIHEMRLVPGDYIIELTVYGWNTSPGSGFPMYSATCSIKLAPFDNWKVISNRPGVLSKKIRLSAEKQ